MSDDDEFSTPAVTSVTPQVNTYNRQQRKEPPRMSFDDDDWDPFWHTPEENAAHDEERLAWLESKYQTDPVFRARIDELNAWDDAMDEQQRGLERIAHDDLIGLTMFGDRDESWLEPRLAGEIDTRPK